MTEVCPVKQYSQAAFSFLFYLWISEQAMVFSLMFTTSKV